MATAPQRQQLRPENVDEGNHGQQRETDIDNDMDDGLTADEEAQLEAMRRGERDSEGAAEPDPADGGGDDGDDVDAGADGVDDDATVAADRDSSAGDDRSKQGDQSERRPPKTINYGRHQREISKREQRLTELEASLKTEREERAKERDRATRLDERTKMLLDAINARPAAKEQEQQDQDPEPDENEDPIAHAQWTRRELGRTQQRLANIEKGITEDRTQRQTQNAEEREFGDYTAEINAAAQADPDFADAFVHLRESRYQELGFLYAGIDVNDPDQVKTLTPAQQAQLSQQIQQSFGQEQMMAYREAKRSQRQVARTIMNLARARKFVPKARDQAQDDDQGDAGQQGRQPARRAAPDTGRPAVPARRQNGQQRSVGAEIDAIREAQASGRSLSDGGGSQGQQIDLQRLADMDDDEFMEVLESMPKGRFDRMMGKQPS